jgi:hypothetical protein
VLWEAVLRAGRGEDRLDRDRLARAASGMWSLHDLWVQGMTDAYRTAAHEKALARERERSDMVGAVLDGHIQDAQDLWGKAARRGDRDMQTYFTRRAQAAAVVAGAPSPAALSGPQNSDPATYGRLPWRAFPLIVVAGVCGLAVLVLLAVGWLKGVRVIAALGVAAVLWGWGVAQYLVLLPGTAVALTHAGAPDSTLTAIVVLFIAAAVLIAPSFALLFTLHGRRLLGTDEQGPVPTGGDEAMDR